MYVPRWKPSTVERLRTAALELFESNGFDETTVEDIAERARVTSRTFFRYFVDKREVVMGGGADPDFTHRLVSELNAIPATVSIVEALTQSLERAVSAMSVDRLSSARRQRVIASSAALRERELLRLGAVAKVLASSLRSRGLDEPGPTLAAETAITVFRIAHERWARPGASTGLGEMIRALMDSLPATLNGADMPQQPHLSHGRTPSGS